MMRYSCITQLKGLIWGLLFLSSYWGKAQNTFEFTQLLQKLEEQYKITFSYDSDLLQGVPAPFSGGYNSLEQALKMLVERSAFNVEASKEGNYLLKPQSPGHNFKISGQCTDLHSRETLPGMSIYNAFKTRQTTSDLQGRFTLYLNYSNQDSIKFTYLGYEDISVPLTKYAQGYAASIELKESVTTLSEVIINYMSSGMYYDRQDNSVEVKQDKLALLPGQTDADVLLSLEALPGINSPDSKAGNLNIRGGTPDQTLILFDNIPIYHKGHYFGTLSPFNSKVVDNFRIYRNSYTADKGGRVGGSVEIYSQQKPVDSAQYSVSLSSIDASAFMHLPIIRNKVSLILAGHSALPSRWMSPKLRTINNFIYQETEVKATDAVPGLSLEELLFHFSDMNAKLLVRPDSSQSFSLSLLRIDNYFYVDILDSISRLEGVDKINLKNWGISGLWTKQWTPGIKSKLTASRSSYRQLANSLSIAIPDTFAGQSNYRNFAYDTDLIAEVEISGKRNNFWKLGYDLHHYYLGFESMREIPFQAPSGFSNINNGLLQSLFASYNLTSLSRLKATLGVRTSYYSLTSKAYHEPRLSMNYNLSKNLFLKSTLGIQRQFVSQIFGVGVENISGLETLAWIMADGKGNEVIKSNQAMLGAMYEKKHWLIDLEGYYKYIDNITLINYRSFSEATPYYYGTSTIWGLDLLVRKRFKNLDTWISYTLSQTMWDVDSVQAEPFPGLYNQTHILDLAATYRWKNFKFSASWKIRSGLPAYPFRTRLLAGAPVVPTNGQINTTPNPSGAPVFLPGSVKQYSDEFPAFHQLDVSLVYLIKPKYSRWDGSLGLSLLNVYNRANIIEQLPRPLGNAFLLVNKYSLGFAPNLMLTINW